MKYMSVERKTGMPDKDLERYLQSPREFRESVRRRLSKEWKRLKPFTSLFTQIFIRPDTTVWRRRQPLKRLKKIPSTRLFKSLIVVGGVCLFTYVIKHDAYSSPPSLAALLFDNAEVIAITSAGIVFLLEGRDRKKRDHYEAWQVINSAKGQGGSGGRIQALQDLNRDDVNLEGLSASGADLSGINLRGAKLERADFRGSQLDKANLRGAKLQRANLQDANLYGANLEEADLTHAELQGTYLLHAHLEGAVLMLAHLEKADLGGANLKRTLGGGAHLEEAVLIFAHLDAANLATAHLERAKLRKANLTGANLRGGQLQEAELDGANLTGACLKFADLTEADLRGANLTGANLRKANLERADLQSANLEGVEGLTQDQLSQAKLCRTTLPDTLSSLSNRDCEELRIDPETGEYMGA